MATIPSGCQRTVLASSTSRWQGGLIEIEETLDTPARCGVIAHEIGHELMHRTNREGTTRQQRELEAESVSYAVVVIPKLVDKIY